MGYRLRKDVIPSKLKLKEFDEALLFSVQRNQSRRLSIAMLTFTIMGNGGLIWAILSGFLIFNPSTSRYGLYMIIALLLCALCNNVIFKTLVDRDRPCDVYKNVPLLIKRPFGSSFPSGHTATSFACAVTLIHMDVRLGFNCSVLGIYHCLFQTVLICSLLSNRYYLGILSGAAVGVIAIQIVRLFLYFVPISYFALH